MRTFDIIFSILGAGAVVVASLRYVHMLQLESYQGNMYVKWLRRAGKNDVLTCMLFGAAAMLLRMAWMLLYHDSAVISTILLYGCDVLYIAAMVYLSISNRKRAEQKKPIVYTSRVKRLLAILAVLSFLFHMNVNLFTTKAYTTFPLLITMNILRYLPGLMLPSFVLLCACVALPIENAVKNRYLNDAKRKLQAREDIIKIAVTGSYGKTSTKFILGTILQEKFNTLVTPQSFNTPMGITRVIREQLEAGHEAFVAEMGARYAGDIDELCDLVQPTYGIITSVGKQHLDTFGSYENVIKTKSELLLRLPEDGAAFLNGDNEDCRQMYENCNLKNKYLFGLDYEGELFLRATDVRVTKQGSTFTLETSSKERVECKTSLLGKHNILNITGAAAVAKHMGLTLEQIASGISNVQPVEHRLQLIEGPVTVIDDAFNANPAGTKAAMEVLRAFAPANRVVVTPGMVELGDEEEALNEAFGKDIASAADVVILVGQQRVEPIFRGLIAAGFDEGNILRAQNLAQVTKMLPQYAPPGSVVLFENDLPDNYSGE
ncbi:UDP-N-acetylmuramoyl-tripeptide--D-alanyl-D-alanine ligase [Eubacteriales bacterium OttesenSCG-928-K08]|nr:UDP-N-acetylmuramoyl-tripeptide--D-alanyl-D-alanine ligase [Eubacteriales bacterium OttesenSCG-928-K08]